MTLANQITIGRILLIPVFVGCAAYYGVSVKTGAPNETWRWAAIAVFALTAVSDALDGFVARRMDQRTRLGGILDPLADKLLLVSAIITLSLSGWPTSFPIWFPILVVSRDLILVIGAILLGSVAGLGELNSHWTGKAATFFQIIAVAWVMLEIPKPDLIVPTVIAGVFTLAAGILYFAQGILFLQSSGYGDDDS